MEILNIEHHQCRLIVKALDTINNKAKAAKELGISERTLYRLMAQYDISKSFKTNKFTANNPPRYQIVEPNE